MSITSGAVVPAFFADYPLVYETAQRHATAVILGGQDSRRVCRGH